MAALIVLLPTCTGFVGGSIIGITSVFIKTFCTKSLISCAIMGCSCGSVAFGISRKLKFNNTLITSSLIGLGVAISVRMLGSNLGSSKLIYPAAIVSTCIACIPYFMTARLNRKYNGNTLATFIMQMAISGFFLSMSIGLVIGRIYGVYNVVEIQIMMANNMLKSICAAL